MTRPVATLGNPDSVSFLPCCVYPVNTVVPIVKNVFANGRPVAAGGDVLTPAPGFPVCKDTSCPPLARVVVSASKVFVQGRPIGHVGDLTSVASSRTILPSPTTVFAS
jgi:uncharacterized Zn-binding protein involved in type VI secretion